MTLKQRMRKEILAKRKNQPKKDVEEKSNKIFEKLILCSDYKKAKNIMIYVSLDDEVSTKKIIEDLFSKNKNVYVPKADLKKGTMTAVKISKKTAFFENRIGIQEPVVGEKIDKDSLDIIIIPAVAYDYWGHRIGFGNGFYDKFLKGTKAQKIGVGFEFQLLESIPAEDHDVKVDMLITEKRMIKYDPDD